MSEVIGFVCCFIAIFCFGTSFVPVKKYEAGDGMFYQWIMCITIWITGLLVQLIQGSPQFEPVAMIGGVLWATGNCLCVPVMRFIGIGLGMLVWATTNLVMGWAAGRFGFFGIDKQEDIALPALNYVGVVVCVASIGIFFFVKTTLHDEVPASTQPSDLTPKSASGAFAYSTIQDESESGRTPIVLSNPASHQQTGTVAVSDMETIRELQDRLEKLQGQNDLGALDLLPERSKQLLGFGGGIAAGLVFGLNFVAPQYLIDHPHSFGGNHSSQSLDYVFSHFCGILLASTFWFFLYSAVKGNRPSVYPKVILPGAASGLLWSAAQISWFVANGSLSFVVTYPLISSGPGLVASLCGVFLFGEIRGKRNYILLVCAGLVAIIGAVLIALSKIGV